MNFVQPEPSFGPLSRRASVAVRVGYGAAR